MAGRKRGRFVVRTTSNRGVSRTPNRVDALGPGGELTRKAGEIHLSRN